MLTPQDISRALAAARAAGEALAIVSRLETAGSLAAHAQRLLVGEQGAPAGGTLGSAALDKLAATHAATLITDEKQEITTAPVRELLAAYEMDADAQEAETRLLFEISRPVPALIICGGGHVGQAVARAGRLLDFAVTVIDDRAEFAARDKFPDPEVRLIAADFIEALQSLRITPAAHLVIVTRGHKHDEMCLREVIGQPARYIGMIGSRRRTTTIRAMLRRDGVAPELLRRVHAPIGLDIGAQTPEEIAMAILGEIILTRRGGTGMPKSQASRAKTETQA